jgi:hypothetical protein
MEKEKRKQRKKLKLSPSSAGPIPAHLLRLPLVPASPLRSWPIAAQPPCTPVLAPRPLPPADRSAPPISRTRPSLSRPLFLWQMGPARRALSPPPVTSPARSLPTATLPLSPPLLLLQRR